MAVESVGPLLQVSFGMRGAAENCSTALSAVIAAATTFLEVAIKGVEKLLSVEVAVRAVGDVSPMELGHVVGTGCSANPRASSKDPCNCPEQYPYPKDC